MVQETTTIIIAVSLLALGVLLGILFLKSKNRSKDNFDIAVDPLKGTPYVRKETDCGTSYSGTPAHGIGGDYGLTPEYDNNITVCNFVNMFEKDQVFGQYPQNLAPTLLHKQTGYEIPARQICEVLYQGHQQYFENMWSGLGECELYMTEQAKKCKNIDVVNM